MELTTESGMMCLKAFEVGHPDYLSTDHLLHIETSMVFGLREKRRQNRSGVGWC